ncbi:erythromycin esterase family protein [Enterovibrio norvegicus]|uniref:Erythromycin esterase n=1 Tax=Enterovibrio norvegicus TaxID=188144 RepID=A0A2N7L8U1_9GAMM|nr:erythromycin esterase family protein [Enterovibrio norvegicus]PML78996.1 hypothetical protein BCT69_15155 [Enterovibrio norvegicus]PMN90722.1 hypothetical protein BCT23_04365 [Enterovibrio norvegicus]
MHKVSLLTALLLVGCNSSEFEPIDVKHQELSGTSIENGNNDLTNFVSAVKGVDIVGIGEATHQGSKAHSYMGRMTKALHQDGDLEIVALEAGLYDGLVAWNNYLTGKQSLLDAVTGPDANFYFMHRFSAQLEGLFNYVNDVDQINDTLILTGYDARMNSDPACAGTIFDELRHYLTSNSLSTEEFDVIEDIGPIMMCPWYTSTEYSKAHHDKLISAVNKLETTLKNQKPLEVVPVYDPTQPRDFRLYSSFWLQIAKSIGAHANTQINGLDKRYSDYQSAENIKWLRDEWFNTDAQVVIFGHNSHVTGLNDSALYAVNQRYPELKTYSVMQLTYSGEVAPYVSDYTLWASNPQSWPKAHNSLNSRLYASGYSDSFIDIKELDQAEKATFNSLQAVQVNMTYPSLYIPSEIMDGILFIPVETPTTPRKM